MFYNANCTFELGLMILGVDGDFIGDDVIEVDVIGVDVTI